MITPVNSFLVGVSTLIWLTRLLLKMSSSKASVMFSILVAALQAAAELLLYPPGAKKLAHFVPEEGFAF